MRKLLKLVLIGVCYLLPINCYSSAHNAWAAFRVDVEKSCMKEVDGRISGHQIIVDKYGTAIPKGFISCQISNKNGGW